MDAVPRCVCALLVDRIGAAGPPDFVPARASDAGSRFDRLVGHQRLVRAKVAVAQPEGRPLPIRQDVEILRRISNTRLREAVAAAWSAREDRVEAGNRELCL